MKQGKGTFVLTEQEHHDYIMRELAAKLKPPILVKGITREKERRLLRLL